MRSAALTLLALVPVVLVGAQQVEAQGPVAGSHAPQRVRVHGVVLDAINAAPLARDDRDDDGGSISKSLRATTSRACPSW
jgi:hypothetical protein